MLGSKAARATATYTIFLAKTLIPEHPQANSQADNLL